MSAKTKVKKTTQTKHAKSHSLGIPKVLKAIRYEKISEVVPVKVQLSLKNFLKHIAREQGVSGWIRGAILEKLEHMTEEDEE